MSKQVATAQPPDKTPARSRATLIPEFAARYKVDPEKLLGTLKLTAFKQPKGKDGKEAPEVTNEQMMALLVVANEYGLNPFTREIYAFPDKGGITPIVSVDGWIRIINTRKELKSVSFAYGAEERKEGEAQDNPWVECTIVRSDRDAPVSIREYMRECWRDTIPWNSHPHRMLRHKALIQCARVAFGYGGIYDPDEAERIANSMAIDSTATEIRPQGKPATEEPQALPSPETSIAQPVRSLLDLQTDLANELDRVGVPPRECAKHFSVPDVGSMTAEQISDARTWLKGLGV